MFKKARFVLNLLQNYKKIGENLQLFREILYFCIKISNIFAFRLLYNQKRALSGVFFLMVYDGSGKRKMEKKINRRTEYDIRFSEDGYQRNDLASIRQAGFTGGGPPAVAFREHRPGSRVLPHPAANAYQAGSLPSHPSYG